MSSFDEKRISRPFLLPIMLKRFSEMASTFGGRWIVKRWKKSENVHLKIIPSQPALLFYIYRICTYFHYREFLSLWNVSCNPGASHSPKNILMLLTAEIIPSSLNWCREKTRRYPNCVCSSSKRHVIEASRRKRGVVSLLFLRIYQPKNLDMNEVSKQRSTFPFIRVQDLRSASIKSLVNSWAHSCRP